MTALNRVIPIDENLHFSAGKIVGFKRIDNETTALQIECPTKKKSDNTIILNVPDSWINKYTYTSNLTKLVGGYYIEVQSSIFKHSYWLNKKDFKSKFHSISL